MNATIYSDKLTVDMLERINPKMILSYNYNHIISKECIDYMQGNILNMHISLLPWNRGASPNVWSFFDGTPKGVTIHRVSEGLDEGDIAFQREMRFDEARETFQSTYRKLNEAICDLCQEHWDELYTGNYVALKQQGKGTKHNLKDLKLLKSKISFEWNDRIADVLKVYQGIERT